MGKISYFHAHESRRAEALEGLPLASFGQRVLGYVIDLVIAVLLWFPLEFAWRRYVLHQDRIDIKWDFHEVGNLVVMLAYYGLANYFGNGQTPGKWIARTRALSLVHDRMGLWQSIERALGYGAAVLEGGMGFVQFFWNPNRMCAQDKLAETVVIDVRKAAKRPAGNTTSASRSVSTTKHHPARLKRPRPVHPRSAQR